MDTPIATLQQASTLLAGLATLPFEALTDEETCSLTGLIEQVGRSIDTLRARSAAEVDDRSRFELGRAGLSSRLGHRRSVHLLEQLTRVSSSEAARRIRLGTAIRPRRTLDGRVMVPAHPHVAAAMIAGTLGVDAAAQIVRCLDQAAPHTAHPDQLDPAEKHLVETARVESADIVAVYARVQREALDPDGTRPRENELRDRRRFSLGREAHGLTTFAGACDPVNAALLRAAFTESSSPKVTPRFLSDEDRARATVTHSTVDGEVIERIVDPRTREQRQHDVFVGLMTAGLRSTGLEPGGMRSTATIVAVVQLADLENTSLDRGIAWLDDVDEPVSVDTVRELACDADIVHVLLGSFGQILALGSTQRLFTSAQRRALAVRDGGCVWPQCTAPPSWCQAHHVQESGEGGATHTDNGVLLCAAHHHMLHSSHFTMKMVNAKPQLLAPPWLDPEQLWRGLGRARVSMGRPGGREPG